MIRRVAGHASSLLLSLPLFSLSLLASGGCCHEHRPTMLPAVQEQDLKVAALDRQLQMAETTGWNSEQERQFSMSMVTLPMKVRIDYAHRLARALTYGQIKVRPAAPPPDNLPACPCGGNVCGVPTPPTPVPQPGPAPATTSSAAPPAAAVPSHNDRLKK